MFTIALNYRLHLACSGQGNAVGRVRLSDRFRSDLNQQTVISCARVGRDLGLKVEVIGQGQGHRSTKNTRHTSIYCGLPLALTGGRSSGFPS